MDNYDYIPRIIKRIENLEARIKELEEIMNQQHFRYPDIKDGEEEIFPNFSNNIICSKCQSDTRIPTILHMVIPSEGLKCPNCGYVVVQGSPIVFQEDYYSLTKGIEL